MKNNDPVATLTHIFDTLRKKRFLSRKAGHNRRRIVSFSKGPSGIAILAFMIAAIMIGSLFTTSNPYAAPLSGNGVIGWGGNSEGQLNIPPAALSDVTAISAGYRHNLALKNGAVIGWGYNFSGQVNIPVAAQSGVTAISAGYSHSLALKNGGVIAWGDNSSSQVTVPVAAQTGVTAIVAGRNHSLALKNGGVIGWGSNESGAVTIPVAAQSGVTAIAAGYGFSMALKSTGQVIVWGNNDYSQLSVPSAAQSGVTAIAAGQHHCLALKNGAVIGWGYNGQGQRTIPAAAQSGVSAIAAGSLHSLALKGGAVIAWGSGAFGQTTVPIIAQTNVQKISGGELHSLALKPLSPPSITAGAALTRQQGSSSVSTIATVSDAETPAGNLTVAATTVPAGITVTSITNANGTISANVAAGCAAVIGANTVVLTATDGNGEAASANLTVNVTANTQPTLAYNNISVNGGTSATNNPTAAGDNGSITYSVQSTGTYSGGISVNAAGAVSFTNAKPAGNHTITIRATDNCGAIKDATFKLTVNNTAPTFTPAAAISRQQGSPAGAPVTIGTVADTLTAAGSLTVTQITGGTATGLTVSGITNNNGTISALVSASCTATAGTLRFRVSDGSLTGTGNLQVNVTANTAPTVTYAAVSVNGGASTTKSPTTATDNGSITSYAVQSKGTYTGTITVNAAGLVSISAAAPVGVHTITIRATDNCGATKDAALALTVNNTAPTFTPAAAISRQLGSSAGAPVTIGTVTDAQTAAGALTVRQLFDGTATGLTVSGITNNNGTISALVSASCTATAGTLRFEVSDGSLTGVIGLQVNVTANTGPTLAYNNISFNGGTSATNNPTAASDNGSITSYVVQSRGTYTGGISVDQAGVVSFTLARPVGNHTITIRATDNCGATKDATFTVTLNNTAPTFTPAAAISVQQNSSTGSSIIVGKVSDLQTAVGSLTVTQIAGGTATGLTLSGLANQTGTVTALIFASCTATSGTLRFEVSDGSLTGTGDLQVNVTANTPPTLTYAAASVVSGGSTTNTPTAAADNSSGGRYTQYTVQSRGTFTGTVSVSLFGVVSIGAAAPVGTHTITIRAADSCGATTDASFTLTVNNTAAAALSLESSCETPVVSITGPSGGAIYELGTTVNLAGAFVDASGGSHTATWSINSITFAGAVNEEARTVSGVYTFTESAVYQLSLTVGNDCGQQGSSNLVSGLTAMVVVYDPSNGYLTGQGSIDSPAGAYPADPSSTGAAGFGFVSKYVNGDSVPSGISEFQFKTANFSFSSTSYEWLVLSGARVQYKGSGTINNADNYGFLLTVIDGQIQGGGDVDKFRIKIWDKATNLVIYDNQINDPDSADPSTALSSGSIIIGTGNNAAVAEYGATSNQEASTREVKRSGAAIEWHIILVGQDGKQSVVRGGSDGPYIDLVAPGDYDGDGEIDLAIFRRATGGWLIWCSTDRRVITGIGNAPAAVNKQ
jgi:alpha-tubulin suppressor-like RCC1 family protein